MKKIFLNILILTLNFFTPTDIYSQDILDDMDIDQDTVATTVNAELFKESILKISPSQKILLISNQNQSFTKGDFISILVKAPIETLVFRALVAKVTDQKIAGIKLLKIYSNELWQNLDLNSEVLVLKGDDSYFKAKSKNSSENAKVKTEDRIEDEDDLFSTTNLNDDSDLSDENKGRFIKPDFTFGVNLGLIKAAGTQRHLNAQLAYQVADNIWAEMTAGISNIPEYPNVLNPSDLNTTLYNYSVRFKYTISAPFYSYIMPYVGFLIAQPISEGAGKETSPGIPTSTQRNKELAMVDELKANNIIYGFTLLKRIVPGWFVRAEVGSDMINGGLCIEF